MNGTHTAKKGRKRSGESESQAGRRMAAMAALVGAEGRAAAARAAGVSPRTLDRWTAEPAFAAELERERRRAFAEALAALRGVAARAVEKLAALLDSKRETERRRAACEILSFALKAHEDGELAARMAEIERILEETATARGTGPRLV